MNKIEILETMVKQIEGAMKKEVATLRNYQKDDLIDHFANKLLKIGWEASKFETGENMIEFSEIKGKFENLNLGVSRYQRILDKLNEEKENFTDILKTEMRLYSLEKIECKF